jgi:hypothetical protein
MYCFYCCVFRFLSFKEALILHMYPLDLFFPKLFVNYQYTKSFPYSSQVVRLTSVGRARRCTLDGEKPGETLTNMTR